MLAAAFSRGKTGIWAEIAPSIIIVNRINNRTYVKKAVFERLGVRLPYVKAMSVSISGTRKTETYGFTYMETYEETHGFTYDYV